MGFTLSILVGPMFFMLLQLGAERGLRAGATAGLGAWVSDSLIILLIYTQISRVRQITSGEHFIQYTGWIGGALLVIIGGGGLLKTLFKQPDGSPKTSTLPTTAWGLWVTAFLTNTFNPFNIFFWLAVVSGFSARPLLNHFDALLFFGPLLGAVIATDLLKTLLARRIRPWLNPNRLLWLLRLSNLGLLLFGLSLWWRVGL